MSDHLENSSSELPVSLLTICYVSNNNNNNNPIFMNSFIFLSDILIQVFTLHSLLGEDSRGQSYLAFGKLILHVCLLQRFSFKDGSDSAAHPD